MSQRDDNPFRRVGSREIYRNPWIAVREDQVIRPSGTPGIFGVVTVQPGVTVLALDDDGTVVLGREYKYGLGRLSLEAFSGGCEPGETALESAQRELMEEAGLSAGDWLTLGRLDYLTTVVSANATLFIARSLRQHPIRPDPDEIIEIVRMPLAEAVRAVEDGRIVHGGTAFLLLRAARLCGV